MTQLGDIAHARTGDKGDTSIIVVAAWRAEDFEDVCETIQPDAVARRFGVRAGDVAVHVIENLHACTVRILGCLDGGVTRSRRADPHGKSLSGHLLEMRVQRQPEAGLS